MYQEAQKREHRIAGGCKSSAGRRHMQRSWYGLAICQTDRTTAMAERRHIAIFSCNETLVRAGSDALRRKVDNELSENHPLGPDPLRIMLDQNLKPRWR